MQEKEKEEAVLLVVAAIPCGQVASYAQVAQLAGLPRRARWVGWILSRLPVQTRLSWHRVVLADGRIARRGGSSGAEQMQRLQREGVHFRGERVDMRRSGWRP